VTNSDPAFDEPLLSKLEAQAYLKCSRQTLEAHVKAGRIPVIVFDRKLRFRAEDLRRFVIAHRVGGERLRLP
jgi:excisionase family DNA binding protein